MMGVSGMAVSKNSFPVGREVNRDDLLFAILLNPDVVESQSDVFRFKKVLPGVDVFVCTMDPVIESPVMVVNKTLRRVRVRGGNVKWRALRLDTSNYSWGSEAVTHKIRMVYNAFNSFKTSRQRSILLTVFWSSCVCVLTAATTVQQ